MERNEGMARCKPVDVQELEHAELQIIKIIQNEAFLNEIQMLKDTKTKLQAVVFLTAANHNVRNAHAVLMKRSYSVVGFRLTG